VTVSTLHLWLAAIAVAANVVLAAVSLAGVATRRWNRLLGDRLVLAVLAATGLAALAGVWLAVTAGPPSDALHLVYGVVAFVVLPVARYVGRSGSARRQAGWLALGSLALLAVYARLLQTGT
jgi:hypothetical protein